MLGEDDATPMKDILFCNLASGRDRFIASVFTNQQVHPGRDKSVPTACKIAELDILIAREKPAKIIIVPVILYHIPLDS